MKSNFIIFSIFMSLMSFNISARSVAQADDGNPLGLDLEISDYPPTSGEYFKGSTYYVTAGRNDPHSEELLYFIVTQKLNKLKTPAAYLNFHAYFEKEQDRILRENKNSLAFVIDNCPFIYTAADCETEALAKGLRIGGEGYGFEGDYGTKGCYAYDSGTYEGIAFFGTGGDAADMEAEAQTANGQYRVTGPCSKASPGITQMQNILYPVIKKYFKIKKVELDQNTFDKIVSDSVELVKKIEFIFALKSNTSYFVVFPKGAQVSVVNSETMPTVVTIKYERDRKRYIRRAYITSTLTHYSSLDEEKKFNLQKAYEIKATLEHIYHSLPNQRAPIKEHIKKLLDQI